MKMQTYKSILFIGTIIALVSCAKQLDSVDNKTTGLQHIVLNAGTEDITSVVETKVYFSDWSTYQLSWANQDKISVFSAGVNYEFSNTASAGQTATFEGSVTPSSSYIALYPYNAAASLTSNVISTVFPSEQSAVADGTDKAALLAVATEDSGNLSFKNVYGIVKFEIIDDDVTSVMLEGNDGEVLAGNVNITVGDNPSYVVTGNPATEILLTPDGASTFAAGDYAVAVLPVEFAHGFKLIFTHEGSSIRTAIKATKDQAFSVARNGGLNAKEMEFEDTDYKYYYIRTKEDLDAWNADYANWHSYDKVYLANDIDYGGGTWVTQTASGTEFRGTFDGRGHSITNIHMTSDTEHSGFLRRVTGTVKNVTIGSPTDDSDIRSTATSSDRSMGVVAMLVGGTIDNVVNYADVIMGSNTAYCGGIAGRVQVNGSVSATISNCTNYGSITCNTTRNVAAIMGGIAGHVESGTPTVSDCYNFGPISWNVSGSAKKANIGGIAGQVICEALITGCDNGSELASGNITVEGSNNLELSLGGIVGYNVTTAATVSSCTNYAQVINHSSADKLYVGGVLGAAAVASTLNDCNNEGAVLDDGTCSTVYSSNTTLGESRTGGILGWASAAVSLTDCKNKGNVNNNSSSVYMNVGGILGVNSGAAASLLRCINTGKVECAPVNNSGNQVIRVAGMVAMSSIAETSIMSCENYGDVSLSNSYTVLRAWVAGGIGYCKYPSMESGKYYATISRGTVSGGQIAMFVGQSDTTGGTLKDNGIGGVVNGTTITDSNYNTGGGIQFGSKSGSWTRTGNYFLSSKPSLASMVSPRMSIDSDNNPW